MDRRRFIKVLGGGVITAAGVAVGGCATSMPAEAIAPWRGPGPEQDVRRWILSYALLAPHSHNLQSWVVDLRTPGEILLRCDLQRLLPETDPYSRQIMMSHGTFLELLDLAAREQGLRARISLFPEGEFGPEKLDTRPVAHIQLTPDDALAPDPLFAQILKRHTNRQAYALEQAVPGAAWQAMAQAAAPYPLEFGYVGPGQDDALRQHRAIAAEAWRIELTTPRTLMESYRVLRIGAEEIKAHRDGLSVTDALPVWMDRLGLLDRSQAPGPDDYATRSQIETFKQRLASTSAFMWMVSEGNSRATQVNAGRAYVRVQLAATRHGLAMQPLQQALQEFPEMAGPYRDIRQLLGVPEAPRTIQMWARVGYAPPVEPAPRRGLDALIARS
ncbi:nitroreductase family protein [Niveibacterium sp. SC-1]|uniref:Acg family FMN-binding oxidoreductase n=1 Tax=Niveibacterium sp. SC-1 TaxID=3135646 RepID=UPI00311D5E32